MKARTRPSDWVLSTASGFLLYAAAPPLSFAALAWVALVPLLLALSGKGFVRRLLLGLVCGTVWSWLAAGPWLRDAAERALAVSPAAAVLLGLAGAELFGGLSVVLFAGLYRRGMATAGALATLGGAALWVGLEWVRSLVGVPWCLIGHSQWASPLLIQIADLSGVYGVSFVIAAANLALADSIGVLRRGRARDAIAGLALVAALLGGILVYGALRLSRDPGTDTIEVQVVHTAWDPARQHLVRPDSPQELVERLLALSARIPPGRARLIVWPENSVRFYLQQVPDAERALGLLASRRDQFLLAGGPRLAGDRFHNSAYLFSPQGELVATRDKRLLVPLTEAPIAGLPSVERPFHPGEVWRPLDVDGRRVGVLVCFEAIFSAPSRVLVRDGADLLINMTNDHLVGDGAEQQAAMAVFRAVENRVPLLRVANLGPTLSVDALGHIVAREPAGEGANVWSVQLGSGLNPTPYTRWGDVFAVGCAAAACLGFLTAAGAKKRSR